VTPPRSAAHVATGDLPAATAKKPKPPSVVVWETYASVQGESTWAGLPCAFIRLTGCPLRCVYCDTEYAFYGGKRRLVSEVVEEAKAMAIPLVEVTGGEPLAQPACLDLLRELVAAGFTVLLETSGAIDTEGVHPEVRVILDMKCPSSGEMERNVYRNLDLLRPHDEVKFVIGDRADFDFARDLVREHRLEKRCAAVLFSAVFGKIEPKRIVEWILEEKLHGVRFQLQAHKFIWPPDQKGV
jgi:7-carboxy-7-deazaguanine synthase